ncbi:MAG: hypothetical protein HN534_01485 [Euryarchaeota archaeon]|nr:hypothetical protein [Euryarchaeota archaeon]MBT3653594.1 hypothetical protein [Euryarchaeota archaeon]MBT3757193.1 hypothetical protein [Euryarchaeota archaeon]MBT4050956.1 hypothetical protein [Euryarchaeota archaeon]MBT4346623.1 hypothetical protein [Euryarchaeota archaeon]|tara:strand:- start:456 stop:716 length:261 start_codon:yes stop_codon:yes gene_type:complete
MSKSKTQTKNNEQENEASTTLIGWARRSRAGGALKLSLHTEAVTNCHSYTTADGTAYVPLIISIAALRRVLDGDQAVTTISQFEEN